MLFEAVFGEKQVAPKKVSPAVLSLFSQFSHHEFGSRAQVSPAIEMLSQNSKQQFSLVFRRKQKSPSTVADGLFLKDGQVETVNTN